MQNILRTLQPYTFLINRDYDVNIPLKNISMDMLLVKKKWIKIENNQIQNHKTAKIYDIIWGNTILSSTESYKANPKYCHRTLTNKISNSTLSVACSFPSSDSTLGHCLYRKRSPTATMDQSFNQLRATEVKH